MGFKLVETVQSNAAQALDGMPGGDASTAFYRGGYAGYGPVGAAAMTAVNVLLALLFILLGLPLFIGLGLVIKCSDGGPVFYRGTRLGLRKRPFFMYKFRTLPVGSQQNLGPMLVSSSTIRLNPLVRFLRDVRLDELPQLFNILKGDMDFVGPRPIRPEVYAAACRNIPDFDRRFAVRPGLIGFSQLFTPHSTPKRLRSIIDNRFLYMNRSFSWDMFIIFYTVVALAIKIAVRAGAIARQRLSGLGKGKSFTDRRAMDRLSPDQVSLYFACPGEAMATELLNTALVDINEAYCRIDTNCRITGEELCFSLSRRIRSRNRKRPYKRKTAHCTGVVYRELTNINPDFPFTYIIEYRVVSPFNGYIVDKYLLKKSII